MSIENDDRLTTEEMAEALPNTSPEEVAAGEAPADEITTLIPEPEEIHEDSPAPADNVIEPTQEIEQPVELVHSENGPIADQNLAHLEDTNVESTANPSQVIEEVKTPENTPEPTVPVNYFQEYISEIMKGNNLPAKTVVSVVERYYSAMKPMLPISIQEGSQAQISLWQAIYTTINTSGNDFNVAWNVWLNMFNYYSDSIFSIPKAFRFFEFMRMPRDQIIAFQRILNLLILTANPTTRAVNLKRIDLEATLSVYFSEKNRMTIMMFYNN